MAFGGPPRTPYDPESSLPNADAIQLARRFHELYEELAPEFDYKTREESALPWELVPERNRELMIAVAYRIRDELPTADRYRVAALRAFLRWNERGLTVGTSEAEFEKLLDEEFGDA